MLGAARAGHHFQVRVKDVDAQREIPELANPARGEWACVIDGETLILKTSMDAAIKAQMRSKMTIGELYQAAGRTDVVAMRELLWVWLQYYYSDRFKTLQSVHVVFDFYGGPKAFWDYVNGLRVYEESVRPPDTHGVVANPLVAQAGTGIDSKSPQAPAA